MLHKPPLTIIVTAWQAQDCLENTLEYMKREMDRAENFGIACNVLVGIDNCASTYNKAMELKKKLDPRFTFFMAVKNVGTYILKNSLLKTITDPETIIYFFDADDVITPNFLVDGFNYFLELVGNESRKKNLILRPPYLCIPDYLMPAPAEIDACDVSESLAKASSYLGDYQLEQAITETIKCLMHISDNYHFFAMLKTLVRLCLYRGNMINGVDSQDLDYGLRDAYSTIFISINSLNMLGGYNRFRVDQDNDLLKRARKMSIQCLSNRDLPFFIRIMTDSMATRGSYSLASNKRVEIRAINQQWINEGKWVAPCPTEKIGLI